MPDLKIPEKDLETFKKQLSKAMGLSFSDGKTLELLAKLPKIQRTFDFPDVASCLKHLTKEPLTKEQITFLAKDLTIGETYFFRNLLFYKSLEGIILPELIQEKRKIGSRTLNIWSAGCCTGEEPYSIAILLHRLLPDIADWKLNLIGTDINEEFLKKAREGIYKDWSFRSTPPAFLHTYFKEREPKKFFLNPEIKKIVRFQYLNLIDHDYGFENIDLVLCNHVLIYFTSHHIREVINKFVKALASSGRLLVSSIEVPFIENPQLGWERCEETIIFRKKINGISLPAAPKAPVKTIKSEPPKVQIKEQKELGSYETIKALADAGKLGEAREKCESFLKVDRVNPKLFYLYGAILHELDLPELAVQALRHCLFLDPHFVMAHFSLGMHLLQLGRMSESKKQIRNALDLLREYKPDELLPGTDEMTSERLQFIAEGVLQE